MRLVPVRASDGLWESVVSLDQVSLRYPWSAKQWQSLSPADHTYGWLRHDEVIGFALVRLSPFEELAHLLKIALSENYRGTGEATRFLASLEAVLRCEKIQRVYLEVETENQAALRFYEREGFVRLRRIAGFYADGANAWTMEKLL